MNILPRAPKRTLVFIGVTKVHYDTQKRIRTYNPVMSQDEWAAFLSVFDEITLLVRVDPRSNKDEGYILDDPRIHVVPIPYYEGPIDFLRKKRGIQRFISRYITKSDVTYCTWVPNPLDRYIAKKVKSVGAELLVRVIGDSAAVAESIVPVPFNRIIASLVKQRSRAAVRSADGVIYVTLSTLQKMYPAKKGAAVLARTNMKFPPELLALKSKRAGSTDSNRRLSLVAVGSQEQNYKGHDLLIDAIRLLEAEGHSIALTIVGDGRLHEELRAQAAGYGLKNIDFIRRVGSNIEVAEFVSNFDMFVMPSRTEGMPKALLEAMSVGVLAVGASVGGIREVLDEESRFRPNSAPDVAKAIRTMLHNPELAESQRRRQQMMIDNIREHYSGSAVLVDFLSTYIQEVNK